MNDAKNAETKMKAHFVEIPNRDNMTNREIVDELFRQAPNCPKHPSTKMKYANGMSPYHDIKIPHYRCELWIGSGVCGATRPINLVPPAPPAPAIREPILITRIAFPESNAALPQPDPAVREGEVRVIEDAGELAKVLRAARDTAEVLDVFTPKECKTVALAIDHLEATILAAWQQLAERDATIRGLREIVDKLPRTADGVPIVPGMKVYDMDYPNACDMFVSASSLSTSSSAPPKTGVTLRGVFSTRDAATAAPSSPATKNETEAG